MRSALEEAVLKFPIGVVVVCAGDSEAVRSARVLEINPAAAKFLDATPDSAKGRRMDEFPLISEAHFLEANLASANSSTPVDLGEVRPSQLTGQASLLRVRAFSLSADRFCLVFQQEDPGESAHAPVQQGSERFGADDRYRLLIQGVKDYAIYMMDLEGRILSWNEGAERLKGYGAEEILGKSDSTFYTPEDRASCKPEAHLQKAREAGQFEEEGWRVRKDGSRVWARSLISAVRDSEGHLYGFVNITRDITERREREAADLWARSELENRIRERATDLIRVNERLRAEIRDRQAAEDQLRALAARLHKAQEAERIRLAREIHDALGQLCTALKIDITFIARKLGKSDGSLEEKAQSALSLVDNLIRSLRQLSAELHPGTLQALGLPAAMEWQAQEFQRHTGIQCQLHLPEKEVELDLERSTAVFRIFQESLTNVARHSEAATVQAAMTVRDGMLTLVVQDDGKGFDTAVAGARGSLGLLGMRERAHLFGGELRIMSTLGKGVTVLLDAPLKEPDKG